MSDNDAALQVANTAMLKIENHEEVCKERYDEIRRSQTKGEVDREAMRVSTDLGFKDLGQKISEGHDKIYGRMWSMMFSMVLTLSAACGTLGLLLLAYIQSRT